MELFLNSEQAENSIEQIDVAIYLRGEKTESTTEFLAELVRDLNISEIAAKILLARGISSVEEARNFLSPTLRNNLPDPSTIKNITKAADIIISTIEAGEIITVYNDFDVDGISSGAQLYLFLQAIGGKVQNYTPSRFVEGYGLVLSAVEKVAQRGTSLLITVDCGITSVAEIKHAKKLGMKTIILDHHIPKEIPDADAVVDPAQEGCPFQSYKLAAAGLVWMLLIVLRKQLKLRWSKKIETGEIVVPDPKDYLDLASLGTICDMVPLLSLNRVIASRGVEALKQTTRVGLIALKDVAGVSGNPRFSAGHVGFGLGPRINAAGRIAEGKEVFKLLTTTDSLEAKSIAKSIDRLNTRRKQIEEIAKEDCIKMVKKSAVMTSDPALALFGVDYHIGVIGIVAQRLVEQFKKPAAVMAPADPGNQLLAKSIIKGSVRSIKDFHVADVLSELGSILITSGGHAEAGGFSLFHENLGKFQEEFINQAKLRLKDSAYKKRISADLEVELDKIDFILVSELQKFGPFGVGNPSPVLISKDLRVESTNSIGDKHISFRVTDGQAWKNCIAWGMQRNPLLRKDKVINISYTAEIESYQGVSAVRLNIKEVW